jgi:hypothetical protein
MRSLLLRQLVATTFFLCASMSANAQHAVHKRPFLLPPQADLSYSIRARQSGFSLSGEALFKWRTTSGKYSVSTETRSPLVGKIVDATSDGRIDAFGLAPTTFVENRWRKDPTTTTFDRTGKVIRFAPEAATFPLLGGEQDRNSVIWQLIAVARANATAFKVDSTWDFFVAGLHGGQGRETRHGAGSAAHRACDPCTTAGLNRSATRYLARSGAGMVSGQGTICGSRWRLHRAITGENRSSRRVNLTASDERILRHVNNVRCNAFKIDPVICPLQASAGLGPVDDSPRSQ